LQLVEKRSHAIAAASETNGTEEAAVFLACSDPSIKPSQVIIWIPSGITNIELLYLW
jgi:hypothetical protein